MLRELFVEEEQIDPHMIIPVLKTEEGKLVTDVNGLPIIERYDAVRPRFIERQDYFTGDWCIINASRASRPKVFTCKNEPSGIEFLRPHMHHYNPKDMAKYNGTPPEDVARMIMNDPELSKQGDICRIGDDGHVVLREVLALYPFMRYHGIKTDFVCREDGTWDEEAFLRSLEQTAKRTRQLRGLNYNPINIRNQGPESGMSQLPEHDQTGGLRIKTNRIRKEIQHATLFYNKWQKHLHDAIHQAEISKDGIRVVDETSYTFTLCPFAPTVGTREVRILLKPSYGTLDQAYDDGECFKDISRTMVRIINAYIRSGVRSLNYAILQDDSPSIRLNILIASSQTYGGMERIHDTLVVEELPEISTQVLRSHLNLKN